MQEFPAVVIAGCGYTGQRVARLLLERGARVIATTRRPDSLADLASDGAEIVRYDAGDPTPIEFPEGSAILHSVPVVDKWDPTPALLASFVRGPSRVVYLSTTGVYGALRDVDETTPATPATPREQLRLDAEAAVNEGPWSSLLLRPAAIYGPGRGVHVSMKDGRFQLAGDGMNFVSRIHVDDLAAIAVAALDADLQGAYPVGDLLPCTSREIAEYCSELLDVPMPPSAERGSLHETRRADRRVDGRAICRLLGVSLRYPTYREGIPASMQ